MCRIVLGLLLSTVAACSNADRGTEMPFDLSKHTSPESARKALEDALPKGTSRDKVMLFLKQANIKCSDAEAEPLACRVIEPSKNMVHVVWSLAFYFDPLRRLDRVVIDRGYSGP
jgi:hypothetical protein